MAKILGLDLGVSSIGYALIDTEKEEILDCGVKIFESGVDMTSGKEVSRNEVRRTARLRRRQYFRITSYTRSRSRQI